MSLRLYTYPYLPVSTSVYVSVYISIDVDRDRCISMSVYLSSTYSSLCPYFRICIFICARIRALTYRRGYRYIDVDIDIHVDIDVDTDIDTHKGMVVDIGIQQWVCRI